eukprot:CAMPEP_0194139672 /NCGR_PEP_ID=MMETSP0152-20130528/9288_1 /TAXON_ID=1049557 /ORGANISM="Thalassiothrix antarctica, Strain L6-D1" /LENGTH=166 /DNA_ID=CAMNT_0038837601 /DNA_START=57 /DNA_END=553 /DNA_ORIENTATION=-
MRQSQNQSSESISSPDTTHSLNISNEKVLEKVISASFQEQNLTNMSTIGRNFISRITPKNMKKVFMKAFQDEDIISNNNKIDTNDKKIVPERFDILCGRDKISHSHIGNRRFKVIIKMNREKYQTALVRDEKTRITSEIVAMIRSCQPGGRFLKLDTETNQFYDVG